MPCRRWLGASLVIGLASTAQAEEAALSPAALMTHVRALTDPRLAGRAAGSPGEAAAAGYAATRLRRQGLDPQYQFFSLGAGQSANVYASIPGRRSDEVIIVGAHLDHLGMRNGKLHPGASDDASGVAVALGLAESLWAERHQLPRTVMVVLFGAEEPGLLGSSHFVLDPPIPIDRMVAMVNLDAIGRPLADQPRFGMLAALLGVDRERATGLLGTHHRPGLRALADAAFAEVGGEVLAAEDLPDLIGEEVARNSQERGDSESFEAVGVPTLFFSEGENSDLHQPSDTADRLHPELLAQRAEGLLRLLRALSAAPLASFAVRSEEPAKRKPPAGLYLPVGLSTGVWLGEGATFHLGAEASAVYLARSRFWLGAHAGGKRAMTMAAWRMSAGPELGYGPLGMDCGYLAALAGGKLRHGFVARLVVGLPILALTAGAAVLGNDLSGEIGILVKWPFAVAVR
jgi:hypothetical protein